MNALNLTFSRNKRLTTPSEFQAVFNHPIAVRSHYFTVLAKPNQRERPRLGIIVAKRWIKKAVNRNYIRRLIRESFRMHQCQLAGLDIIVLLRCALPEKPGTFFLMGLKEQWERLIAQLKKP